jgi:c-di-GMP-binding flagellar brake protein YcgR
VAGDFQSEGGYPMQPQSRNRRFPRIKATHAVMVRLLGQSTFEEFARTRVLGPGGCMFVSEESLGFGSLMELSIALRGRVVKTDGRVVYEIRKSETEHQVGVEFLRISSADREYLETVVATAAEPPVSRRPAAAP